jgi:hypothetical protein
VAVFLLVPPTRALLRPLLVKQFASRTRVVKATYGGQVYDTVERDDPPRPQLEG